MRFIEFAKEDNAWQVTYEIVDDSFSHAFGLKKEKAYDILQVKMFCPVLEKNTWIPVVIENISSRFMEVIMRKIHEAEEYRSI